MFKPVYGAYGTLTAAASSVTNVLSVDAGLFSELQAAIGLNGTDHTYLMIRDGNLFEIVRVSQLSSGLLIVVRGAESTAPTAWLVGARVEFLLTVSAVNEIVAGAIAAASLPASLTFSINAPHTIQKIGNNVGVTIQKLPLSGDGTVSVMNTGDGYTIAVDRGAFGCCDD